MFGLGTRALQLPLAPPEPGTVPRLPCAEGGALAGAGGAVGLAGGRASLLPPAVPLGLA